VSQPTLQQRFCEAGEWTPIPNFFFDKILADETIPDSVSRVLQLLFRLTVGFNQPTVEISLDALKKDAGVSRERAVYAIKVICECWQLFTKVRGQKGYHSSQFTILGHDDEDFADMFRDTFDAQKELMVWTYGRSCPTREQLVARPPTSEMLSSEEKNMSEHMYKEWAENCRRANDPAVA
jgi:hypothetical protein